MASLLRPTLRFIVGVGARCSDLHQECWILAVAMRQVPTGPATCYFDDYVTLSLFFHLMGSKFDSARGILKVNNTSRRCEGLVWQVDEIT